MPSRYLGVDVGGTKIAYGLFDEQRKLIEKYKFPSDATLPPEQFGKLVVDQIHELLAQKGLGIADLGGVGICLPSFIHYERGYVVRTANLPLLREFAARDFFEQALGTRVLLDNDANVAGLAEHRYGAGRGFKHILYCPMSTGIACGIIINNQLFRGSYGWAGEAGHMIADLDTGMSYEQNASGGHIVERIADRIRAGEKSVMTEMCGGDLDAINAHHLEDAYNLGDPLAIWALDRMGLYIGTWLYNLYLTFNINCYVFGGGLVNMGDMLFGRIRKRFDALNDDPNPVYFHFAELGQDFGITGAVELLFDA